MADNKKLKASILTLHRYFIWANAMREKFYDLVAGIAATNPDRFSPEVLQAEMYMSLWYGQLYVVIEGWQALGLSDTEVDKLLGSANVDLLKRYRNGVFHFQENYFDDRFIGFMQRGQKAAEWAGGLNRAFAAYFIGKFSEWKAAKTTKP